MKTGVANLPLHPGRCPPWLFKRMKVLSGKISELIINEYGTKELLRRLSDPYFFQSLACVIGFDWHSSGTTTTTCGALKESLNKLNTGIQVAGGKGACSRKTPYEIMQSELSTKKIKNLVYASKIAAKVDNSVLQDGFQLYHHSFFFDAKGNYAVVQQGMNNQPRHQPDMFGCQGQFARRYHWMSDKITDFVEEPHNAVCCNTKTKALNLTAKKSRQTRKISLDLVKDNPVHIYKHFTNQSSLTEFLPRLNSSKFKNLNMTARHWIRNMDLTKRDKEVLEKAYQIQPRNYEELVSLRGMGPKRIRALALVSDLVYGSEASWKDPVKYAFAHGGKDGTPRPVGRKEYDNTIKFMKDAIYQARLGETDRVQAMRRLQNLAET
jgi:uncharacterized protein